MREDDARIFDLKRKEAAVRNDALRRIRAIGLDEADYARKQTELHAKSGQYQPRDVFWHLANEHVLALAKKNNWHALKMTYWQMARLLFEERRDHLHLSRESMRAELMGYQANPHGRDPVLSDKLMVSTAGSAACPQCRRLDGKIYTIQKALQDMPLPVCDCTNEVDDGQRGWCRCTWMPVTKSWEEIIGPKGREIDQKYPRPGGRYK